MAQVFSTASGFFIMIFIGFFMKKKGILTLEDKELLGKLLLNVCLPAVVVTSFQDFTFDTSLILAFFIGSACNLLGIFVAYHVSRKSSKENRASFMLLTSGYNIGIFTIPFVSSFFSSAAVLTVLMYDVGNAIFVMGISAAIVNGVLNNEKGNPIPEIFNKMRKSVTINAYVVMFILVGLQVEIPEILFSIARIPANATSFLAMIMVGLMLEFKIDKKEKKDLMSLLFLRYAYGFALVVAIFFLVPLDLELRKALMIGVMSPISTASVIFAQTFGAKPSLVGGASTFSILLSMLCIVSISAFVS